jgi:tetratricopeptide (TPR) repeat protein
MATDKLGLEFTASLPETADAFNAAMDDYMLFKGEPVGRLLETAEVDPDFAMGYCLTGCLRLFGGVGPSHPRVSLELRAARARRSRVMPREQAHIDAFETAATGEFSRAGRMWDDILEEYPHDMMAAKCAHESYFLVGEARLLRKSVQDILPKWTDNMPYYGYLLGMGSFGLEEAGDYAEAEKMGRRAVEIEPRDGWAVHAVAHVLQMQGRCTENIEWLESTVDDWRDAVWLSGHLWWHLCLPLLEMEQYDRVLDIYDARMANCDEDMVTRLMDCTSMLWRLEELDLDVGDRWEPLADKWMRHADEHAIAFTDAHFAMTMAAADRQRTLRRFTHSQHAFVEAEASTNGDIIGRIGQSLCEGVGAYRDDAFDVAADKIGPVIGETWRIGGSNAQRDVFRLTLTNALLKAGRHAEARDFLEPLVEEGATPSLLRDLAAAYDGLGRDAEAEELRAKAISRLN